MMENIAARDLGNLSPTLEPPTPHRLWDQATWESQSFTCEHTRPFTMGFLTNSLVSSPITTSIPPFHSAPLVTPHTF